MAAAQIFGSPGVAVATSGANTLTTVKALCLDTMLEQPQTCVHRDYHCRNLLFNQNQLGVVDFQDALIGPGLYDIASLLRDCYYRHNEAQVDHYLVCFCNDLRISMRPSLLLENAHSTSPRFSAN
ncbi:MAG: hypothetical protein CM15mP68_4030 [Pseudomonadota bacterium]|nr:MAG: hypothetical protein CM15mP68_4030 [Pseudomonadota bacterium]